MASLNSSNSSKFSTDVSSSTYPFLVHSQHTLPFNLPPNVDNKPLARQKRKRTSPEDQAILEAEFLRDPRPDKAARYRIQERVALGDKEVQIWFQNRRQNTRRRARPLEPHEIFSRLQPSSSSSPPAFPASSQNSSFRSNSCSEEIEVASNIDTASTNPNQLDSSSRGITRQGDDMKYDLARHAQTHIPVIGAAGEMLSNLLSKSPCSTPEDSISTETQTLTSSGSGIVHRAAQHHLCKGTDELATSIDPPENEPQLLIHHRSRSNVRLSTTKDGNAKIITGDESSPSPTKSRSSPSPRRTGLRRTQSVMLNSDILAQTTRPTPAPLRRGTSGRSRDSRAWEFWCDSDSRNELAKKAEQAQSGSAADAIGLMRSSSRGPVLAPNLAKLNTSMQRRNSGKRAGQHLRRSTSSVGRLQSGTANMHCVLDGDPAKKGTRCAYSPSGDSDKENVEPGMGQPSFTAAAMQKRSKGFRAVLGDTTRALGLERGSYRGQSGDMGRRGFEPEADVALTEFMRKKKSRMSESESVSSTGEDDLDCVQGLLSLSQGNWC